MTFEPGKVTALVGPNGAGKTTLFHILSDSIEPDQGNLLPGSRATTPARSPRASHLHIGRLFQDVRIFPSLSVLENVLVAQANADESLLRSAFGRVNHPYRESIHNIAMSALQDFGIADIAQEMASSLSFGQQKLVAMARLSAAAPRVLLLDEPTSGINASLFPTLTRQLRNWAGLGTTVILVEHNLEFVTATCDFVHFLDEGRLAASGTAREVVNRPELRRLYLGFK